MKTTRRIMSIVLSLLLVSGNMAFAQNQKALSSKKLTQKVERTVAKAAQKKKPLSVQFMNEINLKAINGERNRAIKQGVAFLGHITSFGLVLASSVHGGALILPAAAIGVISTSPFNFLPHAVDQTNKYPEIQKALSADLLKRFVVVLVNPSKTSAVKKELIQFLLHPRRDYPAEKLKNGEYRFYFSTYRRDIYVDINAEDRIIFVRRSALSSSDQEQEIAHYIKGSRYRSSPYIKDGLVYINIENAP